MAVLLRMRVDKNFLCIISSHRVQVPLVSILPEFCAGAWAGMQKCHNSAANPLNLV